MPDKDDILRFFNAGVLSTLVMKMNHRHVELRLAHQLSSGVIAAAFGDRHSLFFRRVVWPPGAMNVPTNHAKNIPPPGCEVNTPSKTPGWVFGHETLSLRPKTQGLSIAIIQ
jgi:hypothetical protein